MKILFRVIICCAVTLVFLGLLYLFYPFIELLLILFGVAFIAIVCFILMFFIDKDSFWNNEFDEQKIYEE